MSDSPEATTSATGEGRYSTVAIILHWVMAALIIFAIATGFLRPAFGLFVAFHVSVGITVLILAVARIAWRLTHPRPAYEIELKGWERRASAVTHFLLYAAMLFLPLSGWAVISCWPPKGSPGLAVAAAQRAEQGLHPYSEDGPPIWGLFELPRIPLFSNLGRDPTGLKTQDAVHSTAETVHLVAGWTILSLLLVHIAGALKHQFFDRRGNFFARMGIGRRR